MSENKSGTNLKFLHCSDVHLDTPYAGISQDKSEERRRELRNNFLKMMDYVRNRAVDYVLISGDLFDTDYLTNSTVELLVREFHNCPDTKFIIAPGPSDHYENNPIYTSGRIPKNCYVFNSEHLARFDFDDKVTIYGWAFNSEELHVSPLRDKHVDDVSKINIVCGYADVDGELNSTACPISTDELKKFGADYYALGSRHEASDFINLDASMYSYCGALECTGFDTPGIGGAKFVSVTYNEGELSIDAKSMSFGHTEFHTETLDITGVDSNNEIINRISRLVSDKKYGAETALRIILTGYVDPRFSVPQHFESEAFGLYYFELTDKTLPLYNTEKFKRDMTVRGEIFRQLRPLLESEDEEERLIAAKAFREGLAALEGRETEI